MTLHINSINIPRIQLSLRIIIIFLGFNYPQTENFHPRKFCLPRNIYGYDFFMLSSYSQVAFCVPSSQSTLTVRIYFPQRLFDLHV